jgi:hypothetical protein
MLVPIYMTLAPGADRPYVSTTPRPAGLPTPPGWKFFRVDVELPGFDMLEGQIVAVATPVDQPAIRLLEIEKPV